MTMYKGNLRFTKKVNIVSIKSVSRTVESSKNGANIFFLTKT